MFKCHTLTTLSALTMGVTPRLGPSVDTMQKRAPLSRCASGLVALLIAVAPAAAQDPAAGWSTPAAPTAIDPALIPPAPPPPAPPSPVNPPDNVTVVPRTGTDPATAAGAPGPNGQVQLVALLTQDGQRIDQGVVWRVFQEDPQADRKASLLSTHRDPNPTLRLNPGNYVINAAFGRAHLTRKIKIAANTPAPIVEQFVLNAGGLRVAAVNGGKPVGPGTVSYSIYSDRDQTDSRKVIMSGARPGLIIRLNAGIYHIVSTYGDANATVRSDVTVEAGKLTEANLIHTSAKVSFKLVARAGGEALPDTHWTIQSLQGATVKESVGALPTHTLAPGTYAVIAKSQDKAYRKDFTVRENDVTQVEVVLK